MRRKTKQLLATGMALAVLATNLTPVSLAAEMAAEMQTGTAATQTQPEDVAVQALWDHSWQRDYTITSFNQNTGALTVRWTITCNQFLHGREKSTGTVTWNAPDKVTPETCTTDKVYSYNSKTVTGTIDGENISYTITVDPQTVSDTKLDHDYSWSWTKDGYATVTCSRGDLHEDPMQGTKVQSEEEKELSKAATCTTDGAEYYHYEVQYGDQKPSSETFNDVIPATGHSYGEPDVVWTGDNVKVTWKCSKGDDVYTATGTASSWVTPEGYEQTCNQEGTEFVTATVTGPDGKDYNVTKENKFPQLTHTMAFDHFEWPANLSTDPNDRPDVKAVYKCQNTKWNCEHTESTTDNVFVSGHEEKAATCTEPGTFRWTVAHDGHTDYEDVVIPPTGHTYQGQWTNWKFTDEGATVDLVVTCKDGDFKETIPGIEAKEVVTAETKAPTCDTAGTKFYQASYKYEGVTEPFTSGLERTSVGVLGHDYQVSEWVWNANEDYTASATLVLTCKRDGCTFRMEVPATVEKVEADSHDATCTEDGVYAYKATATYDNVTYTTESNYEVTVPATGHNFYMDDEQTTWNDETKKVTLHYGCWNCDYADEETLQGVKNEGLSQAPTCTEDGWEVYEAAYNYKGNPEKDEGAEGWATKKYDLPALGHDFTKLDNDHVEFTFSEDGKTAMATIKCDRCDETDTVEAKVTSKVTTDPGCTTVGTTTYTATLGNAKATTTRDDVEPTGHTYDMVKADPWNAKDKTVTLHFECIDCHDTDTLTVQGVKNAEQSVASTCTANGVDVYDAVYTYAGKTEKDTGVSGVETASFVVPATGHHFGTYTCTANGTEVATCEYCGAADVRPAGAETVCDHHDVDGTDVCPVCGKVNGNALLPQITADSNANTKAITSGAQLVVRAGTLPNGQKVLTVAYLDANGKVLTLNGSWKVRVPVAQLKAALGDAEGTGFEHTLTTADAKQTVGYAVENGNVVFDAAFNGSTAFVLLVD